MRRALEPTEVTFEAPLRARTRIPRGSELLNATALRRVLTWARVGDRPDAAVVLVDEDGKADRRAWLEGKVADLPVPVVVGVAVREFESWLLADTKAVAAATNKSPQPPRNVEKLRSGEAKDKLTELCDGLDGYEIRLEIAKTADLTLLRKLRSFEAFSKSLVAHRPT